VPLVEVDDESLRVLGRMFRLVGRQDAEEAATVRGHRDDVEGKEEEQDS
jgi:hypothetical protein